MLKRKVAFATTLFLGLFIFIFLSSVPVSAASTVLKEGMQGSAVTNLQKNLKTLGYFSTNPTGYYGGITAAAVKKLQSKNGIYQDGIAGSVTLALVQKLLGKSQTTTSRGEVRVLTTAALLKAGMQGSAVAALQKNLKVLGYFSIQPTGYFGKITTSAVKKFQSKHGLVCDGIAGASTLGKINKLVNGAQTLTAVESRGDVDRGTYLVPWFGGAEKIFAVSDTATIYDIDTGLSFQIKRTYGYNHADCETLTAEDTAIMNEIYGGQWSWSRRAIIVTVGDRKLAASMAGMPHAGDESQPANAYVSWRSEGYGAGTNLDAVKGNGIDGHFDVHFLGSKTHGTDRVDEAHQSTLHKAADWAEKNL